MAMTEQEKVAVAYHLGYAGTEFAPGLNGGFVTSGPFSFAFTQAITNLRPAAEPFIRRCISEMQCIEDKMTELRRDIGVVKVGGIELNTLDAMGELEAQYKNWGKKMADLLGVPRNPFSEHWADIDGGGRCIEPM
jgi:hypothetical protein